jgi:hypothetical protein
MGASGGASRGECSRPVPGAPGRGGAGWEPQERHAQAPGPPGVSEPVTHDHSVGGPGWSPARITFTRAGDAGRPGTSDSPDRNSDWKWEVSHVP